MSAFLTFRLPSTPAEVVGKDVGMVEYERGGQGFLEENARLLGVVTCPRDAVGGGGEHRRDRVAPGIAPGIGVGVKLTGQGDR